MRHSVTILGAGPAGLALATELQNRGTHVLVYSHREHLRHINCIRAKGHLKVRGQGPVHLSFTTDIRHAIEFSRIVFLTVPSTGQETILEELRPFALHRHTVIAIPGNLFTLVSDLDIGCVLEVNLSPYSCRMQENELLVLGKKEQLFIAASSTGFGSSFYETINGILPVQLNWCSSVIEVCLLNINGIFHPLMMIMNAGWIESTSGKFYIYRDGLTPAVANAMEAVDRVRVSIGQAFGLRLKSALEVSNECYGHAFTSLVDLGRNSTPHQNLEAPPDLGHRNISEDVPDLLVCWLSLAEKLGIDASPIRTVIMMVQLATGIDYMEIGRNSHKLRLDDISREDLLRNFSTRSRQTQPATSYRADESISGPIMSQL